MPCKFIDISIKRGLKKYKCDFCEGTIDKGERRYYLIEDVGLRVNRINAHFSCFNEIHRICGNCRKKCNSSCIDCFIKNTEVIKENDIMEKIKFMFDNIKNIKFVEIDNKTLSFVSYRSNVVAWMRLEELYGKNNVIFPNKKQIYRDWYKED